MARGCIPRQRIGTDCGRGKGSHTVPLRRALEDRQGGKDFITVTSLGALPGEKGGQPSEMAANAPHAFRKQMAVTQKFWTDCCLHIPSWASRPRHRTRHTYTVSYLLTLVSICHGGKTPGHKLLKAPGTNKL